MKNLLFISAFGLLVSCTSGSSESTGTDTPEPATPKSEEGIGFNNMLPEMKWKLGTEAAIQVVKDLDKKWEAEDYDAMRTFFADTAVMYFPDGSVAKSGDEAIAMIKERNDESEASWTFDYAFSVDLDPTRGGEHVQAGFTVTEETEEGQKEMHFHEWYYIVEGKIITLYQFTIDGSME